MDPAQINPEIKKYFLSYPQITGQEKMYFFSQRYLW
jgi:hypothetical protein